MDLKIQQMRERERESASESQQQRERERERLGSPVSCAMVQNRPEDLNWKLM